MLVSALDWILVGQIDGVHHRGCELKDCGCLYNDQEQCERDDHVYHLADQNKSEERLAAILEGGRWCPWPGSG